MAMRMPTQGAPALADLFLGMFSSSELRRLLRYLPQGERLSYALPGPGVSPADLAYAAVEALERQGLVDAALFDALANERPRRRDEIDAVRRLWPGAQAGPDAAPDPDGPTRYDLFLIHASADKRRVRELYGLLRERGRRVFLDESSLMPGDDWSKTIPDALRGSEVAVVLISDHLREARWASDEIARAVELSRDHHVRLVPVFLDGWTKDVPFGLSVIQGLNAADLGLERVADELAAMTADQGRVGS